MRYEFLELRNLVSIGKFVGRLVQLTYGKILWRRFEGDEWRFSKKTVVFQRFWLSAALARSNLRPHYSSQSS